jgi:hypothetical protein
MTEVYVDKKEITEKITVDIIHQAGLGKYSVLVASRHSF